MGAFVNLAGQKFGRLTALEPVGTNKQGNYLWKCRCDCGKEVIVRGDNLKNRHSTSCGCFARENISAVFKQANTKHGLWRNKFYRLWLGVKRRCYNPNDKSYHNYGARGITMYEPWINDFQAFYNYISTLEHFGEAGRSLDRIENNKGYEPGNLRYATAKEQNRNQRRNIIVEYEGEKICLKDAAKASGINYGTLLRRYHAGDRGDELFRAIKEKRK